MEKNSCCAGSCYLNKQLKENETKEQTAPVNEKERVEYVSDLFNYTINFLSASHGVNALSFPNLWTFGQPKSFAGSIFHPPSKLV